VARAANAATGTQAEAGGTAVDPDRADIPPRGRSTIGPGRVAVTTVGRPRCQAVGLGRRIPLNDVPGFVFNIVGLLVGGAVVLDVNKVRSLGFGLDALGVVVEIVDVVGLGLLGGHAGTGSVPSVDAGRETDVGAGRGLVGTAGVHSCIGGFGYDVPG
jgi:hypothetical protein